MSLFDYIYIDIDKAVSLYSQLTGRVVELQQTQLGREGVSNNTRNYDFRVFKHGAGGTEQESELITETTKPHHALLQELEELLEQQGYMLDLGSLTGSTLKDPNVRSQLKKYLCVKCSGRVVVEDYERIKKVATDYPEIAKFINNSAESSIRSSEEYLEISNKLAALESSGGDGNKKARNRQKVKELRKQLDALVQSASEVDPVEDWILEGMRTWIDSFLPKITNIRMYPFQGQADEQVFGHLETSMFTVSNPTSFHFTYGSFPTEQLTMIGIISSVPEDSEETFDPLAEFGKEELTSQEIIESAFRGVFRGFDGLEAMVRTIRYPRVLVHPILVYREAKTMIGAA